MNDLDSPESRSRPCVGVSSPGSALPESSAGGKAGSEREGRIRRLIEHVVRAVVVLLVRSIYRIRPVNRGVLPSAGGALLVANHVSYIDAFILTAAAGQPVRFVIFDHYMRVKWMVPFLKLAGVVPISPTRAKDAVRSVAEAVRAGDLVCIFPEGQLTRTGMMNEIKKGFQLMVRQAAAPVIPVYMDDLWGSIFSFERGRFLAKRPYRFPFRLAVHFGDPLQPAEATSNRVREVLMDLSAEAIGQREELALPVEVALLRQLRRKPWRTAVMEYAKVPRRLQRSAIFASALELAGKWRQSLPADELRIGVVLPNSSVSVLVNLGLRLAGRVPVNIILEKRYRASEMRVAMEAAGIRTVISTAALRELLGGHFWPETVLDMSRELRFSTGALWLTRAKLWLTPRAMDWKLAGVERGRHDPHAPAVAWLSEDSDGKPLFTEVSHRDLLANIEKMHCTNAYRAGDVIFSEPHFAGAAGTMLSLWYPLFRGMPVVMLSAAADVSKWRAAVAGERISWIIAGPVAEALLLTGHALPEPSPLRILQTFRRLDPATMARLAAATGVQVCRCLASDRSGGLLAIGIPDPDVDSATAQHQPGALPEAAGRLLPGTTARVVAQEPRDDESWETLAARAVQLTDPGHIVLRGAGLQCDSITHRCPENLHGCFNAEGFLILQDT